MLHKMPGKQWQTMLDVHCTGPFRLIQASVANPRGTVAASELPALCICFSALGEHRRQLVATTQPSAHATRAHVSSRMHACSNCSLPPARVCPAGGGALHARRSQSRDCSQRAAAPSLHPERVVCFRFACAFVANSCGPSRVVLVGLLPMLRCDCCCVVHASTHCPHARIGQANYATAKAGVVGLTKAVAKEWGPFGVRCNCLTYGYINTRWGRCAAGVAGDMPLTLRSLLPAVLLAAGCLVEGEARCCRLPSGCPTRQAGAQQGKGSRSCLIAPFRPTCRRLVQGKEKGATIEVEGEKVALGIPQASSNLGACKRCRTAGCPAAIGGTWWHLIAADLFC